MNIVYIAIGIIGVFFILSIIQIILSFILLGKIGKINKSVEENETKLDMTKRPDRPRSITPVKRFDSHITTNVLEHRNLRRKHRLMK